MKLPEKVYLIDTNVILRYLLGDHVKFSQKAEDFMLEVSKGVKKAEILDIVVVECIYVMEKFYNVPKSVIVDKLSKILNFSGIINPDRSKILKALFQYEKSNIDIVDCILASQSSLERVVVSFDKDFEKLEGVFETF